MTTNAVFANEHIRKRVTKGSVQQIPTICQRVYRLACRGAGVFAKEFTNGARSKASPRMAWIGLREFSESDSSFPITNSQQLYFMILFAGALLKLSSGLH